MMRIFIIILFFASTFISCERRPLVYDYYPYADLTIKVDWTKAFPVDEKPTGVSVWFYPQDGGKPIQTYSANVDNHKVAVEEGTYDVVVFNLTPFELSSTIGFRGEESLSTLEVYSKEIPTKNNSKTQNGLLTYEPEEFAITVYRNLEVTEAMVEDTWYDRNQQDNPNPVTNRIVEVAPELANKLHKVRVLIKGFHNLADNGVIGILGGLAEGHLVNIGKPNIVNAKQMLIEWEQVRSTGEYSIGEATIEYRTWGLISNASYAPGDYEYWEGVLDLTFLLADNKTTAKYSINLDKNNIKNNNLGTEIDIEILIEVGFQEGEDITLPDVEPAEGDQSGFRPEINPWDEEDVPIIIG